MSTYEMGPKGFVKLDVAANSIKNNLPPGAVLAWGGNMGFPAQAFAVIRREEHARSWDKSGAVEVYYDCLSLMDYAAHRVEALHLKSKNDPGLWHTQHFFLTELVLSADELLDLIEKNKVKVLADEATKNQATSAFDSEVKRLRALNNGLEQSSETVYAGHVLAAKNIRKQLKKAWPLVKFSVTSKSYSGGNSIDVRWTDGPTTKQVEKITNAYSGGDFDGMTDSYTHSSSPWTHVFGSGKYIHESREFSPAVEAAARADVARELGVADLGTETPVPEDWRPRFWTLGQAARHYLYKMDLAAGYKTPASILMIEEAA